MASESNKSRNRLLLILLIIPTVAMLGAVIHGRYRIRHPLPLPPPPPEQQVLLDKWKGQEFVSLEGNVDLGQIVEGFKYVFDEPLSDLQKDELANSLVDFLASYQRGTFESVTKWRIPVTPFRVADSISNAMVANFSIPVSTVLNDLPSAWKQWWASGNHYIFTNYWVGLSVSNCEVRVQRSTEVTNALATTLLDDKCENVGFVGVQPSILFKHSPEDVLAAEGYLKVVTVRILPKTRNNGVICPVYYRAYWSPQDKKWLPEGLVSAYSRSDRELTLFF